MKNIKKSILAGIMIGIGGIAYLSIGSKIIGALLFSFGLISIMYQKYNLFTGQVGYVHKKYSCYNLFITLIFNCVSVSIIGFICSSWLRDEALYIVENKLLISPVEVFFRSIFCGIVIFLAVELFKKDKIGIWTPICIMLFILCGFEHCIADTFYFATSKMISWEVIQFILITIIGNSIGSILIYRLGIEKTDAIKK